MPKKTVCVVTGSRAEYGILYPVLKKIEASTQLELQLLVTGMHILKKYGNTVDVIKKEGIPIKKVIPMYDDDVVDETYVGKALGNVIVKFTDALNELKPDIVLVLGDRFEPLAAVLAATTLSIPIAHIHGGDNVHQGQIDEVIRHSITKFSHIHFPVTPKSSERIKLLGEEEWRIHMVGSPSIDSIYNEKLLTKKEIFSKFEFSPSQKLVLCIQHPYLFEVERAGEQMDLTLRVLKELKLNTVIIYPNNDPGSELIINTIESNRSVPHFKIYKNLERIDYLSLLKNVDLLIGNSSSGLIETPIFKLPVINIGDRNRGRESAENVINVPHNYGEIQKAVNYGLSEKFKNICLNVKNPYGDGKAAERIIRVLEDLQIDKKLLIKQLTYEV